MDFGFTPFILLQAVSPPAANAALAGDLTDGGVGAVVSRTATDLMNRGWGWGKKDSHAPGIVLIVGALVFGTIGVFLMLLMKGVDILNPQAIATAIFQGCTQAGPLAIAGTEISKDAREPAKVDAPAEPAPTLPLAPEPEVVPTLTTGPEPEMKMPPEALGGGNPGLPSAAIPPQAAPDSSPRARIIAAAEKRLGMPYRLDPPPDGVNNIDCSLFVLRTYQDAGIDFPPGVRTAEQIRQACVPIPFSAVQKGDLLFFEGTYDVQEPVAADGHVASHIGISYGAGTRKMIDAHGAGVQVTDIGGSYWQGVLFEARRASPLVSEPSVGGTLTDEVDHQFTLAELLPHIEAACAKTGFDPQVLAAICYQESSFLNHRVHFDGTGAGLFGLDDNGMLPDFEAWSGITVGRGERHISIPPVAQIDYAAYQLQRYANVYGDVYAAARAWHRGGGNKDDELGRRYESLIRAHVRTLFGANS